MRYAYITLESSIFLVGIVVRTDLDEDFFLKRNSCLEAR